MKKYYIIACLIISLCYTSIFSQSMITRDLQGFRGDDVIYKHQVLYKDPGLRGENVLWDFSKLKTLNEKYKVKYYTPITKRGGDSICITCLEHRTMYRYVNKGDSLLLMGFENSGTKITYQVPQYVMRFPFMFGDSISSSFVGFGSHEHSVSTEANGKLTVVADAIGTLILPDGDTLLDVLRVRSIHDYKQRVEPLFNEKQRKLEINKDSVQFVQKARAIKSVIDSSAYSTESGVSKDKGLSDLKDIVNKTKKGKLERITTGPDSIYFRTEICRWYAPGYRYPLFETLRNFRRSNQSEKSEADDVATAFYYPPTLHTYLDNDIKNKAILDSLGLQRKNDRPNTSDTLRFVYNLYPNPVKTNLNVELLLDIPSRVQLTISTIKGNKELYTDFGYYSAGLQNISFPLSRISPGYHVLNIQVNEQIVREVILKK